MPCKNLEISGDFRELNSADARGIDEMRALVDGMKYSPSFLEKKIYVLDEVHQLTSHTQELLLKALEEPPEHVVVFLCTTKREGLKRTLVSRAFPVTFKRITRAHSNKIADQVLTDHGVELGDDAEKVRDELFSRANGSVRDLLTAIELYMNGDLSSGGIDEPKESGDVVGMSKALMTKNWSACAEILGRSGVRRSPESFRIGVANYLRGCCLRASSVQDGLGP